MKFIIQIINLMLVYLLLSLVVEIICIYLRRTNRGDLDFFLNLKIMVIFDKLKWMRFNFEEWIYSTIAKKLKQASNKSFTESLFSLFNRLFFGYSRLRYHVSKFIIFRLINSQRYKITVKISKFILVFFKILVLILSVIEIYLLGEIKHPFLYLVVFGLTYVYVRLILSLKEYFKLRFFGEVDDVFDYVSIRGLIKNITLPAQYINNFYLCPIEYRIKLKLSYVVLQIDYKKRVKQIKADKSSYYRTFRRRGNLIFYKSLFKKEKIKKLQYFYQCCYVYYQVCKFVDMETSEFLYSYFIYPIKFLEIFVIIGILSMIIG